MDFIQSPLCAQELFLIQLQVFYGAVDDVTGLLRFGQNHAEEPIGFVEHARLQRLDRQATDDCDQQLRLRWLAGPPLKATQLLHTAICPNKQQFQIFTTETHCCPAIS
jgi:hypothetical protein